MTACQGVFCGGVKNSTIALPHPSLSSFLSLFLVHHSLSHPSSHCPLLLNVSLLTPLFLSSTLPNTPSHFLSPLLAHFPWRRDAFTASHLRLPADTPLILLCRNLQRKRDAPVVLPLHNYPNPSQHSPSSLVSQFHPTKWMFCAICFHYTHT